MSGTSVLLWEVTVSGQTGGHSLQTLCPCRVLLCPFFTVQTFHRRKAVHDPLNKDIRERGNFPPFSSKHILNVEASAIERVILNLTISNQNYFEEMRAI